MGTTTHSIEVKAPLQSVYDQWTQFEEFPRFMRDVVEVRQHGPDALSWKVLIGGKEKQWEAQIVATRVTVVMEYEPEGFLEKAGDILGVPSGHVEESLKSFRELIESKSTATGGWRGRIGSTDLETASVDKELAPAPATTSASGFRASNEAETDRQAVPVTETQASEHETGMMARPNGTDQALQNRRLMTGETETPPVKAHTTVSVLDPALPAVPVTDLDAGEHEAGMVARVSDKEEPRKVEQMNIALNDLERETASADTAGGLRCKTFFEPNKEDIARRAYDLYLARGQAGGHEMDDWIEAKRQLLEESNSKI